eukprot:6661538-Pyramimonas_sp.AAC.1
MCVSAPNLPSASLRGGRAAPAQAGWKGAAPARQGHSGMKGSRLRWGVRTPAGDWAVRGGYELSCALVRRIFCACSPAAAAAWASWGRPQPGWGQG